MAKAVDDPKVRICDECFAVMLDTARVCPGCDNPMLVRARDWTKHSANERSVTYRGKLYFAGRHSARETWMIEILTGPEVHGSRHVCTVALNVETRNLSEEIMRIPF